MKTINSEINRYAPILGLPAISTTAPNSFCTLYGSLEQRTTFLLNGFPQQAYTTRGARASANTSAGLNLVPGDYVLVPHVYAAQLEPMIDVANAVATRVRAEHTAIFLDTCYGGNAASPEKKLMAPGIASGAVAPSTLEHIRQGSGRIIFTASGVNEESLERDAIKHGYFTYYVVQALEQQGGGIPLSQAFAFVLKHVHERAQSEAHAEQTPC